MSIAQRFAQVFGAVYLLVGILGFIPPLLIGTVPGAVGPFAGLLIGLFAVNWFHSLAHLLIGAVGIAVYRSFSASRAYAFALGVAYGGLFLVGIITGGVGLGERGGLLPLNGWDNVLHVLTALVAFGAFFSAGRSASERMSPPRG